MAEIVITEFMDDAAVAGLATDFDVPATTSASPIVRTRSKAWSSTGSPG